MLNCSIYGQYQEFKIMIYYIIDLLYLILLLFINTFLFNSTEGLYHLLLIQIDELYDICKYELAKVFKDSTPKRYHYY